MRIQNVELFWDGTVHLHYQTVRNLIDYYGTIIGTIPNIALNSLFFSKDLSKTESKRFLPDNFPKVFIYEYIHYIYFLRNFGKNKCTLTVRYRGVGHEFILIKNTIFPAIIRNYLSFDLR